MCSTKSLGLATLAIGVTLMLAACGGGSSTVAANTNTTQQGALIFNPPFRIGSVTAAAFTTSVETLPDGKPNPAGVALLTIAGPPVCGIDFYYMQYYTVGGAGEATNASGALMVPTGPAAICTGKRPIVLYAHGTASTRSYNIADPTSTTNEAASESGLIAAMFAAQGYIVVAPNYPGYDSSPLTYHPFLNADALGKDMINALTAARSALGHVFAASTLDSGVLFVTGYSEGGHVAMATHRAMQQAGMMVTAAAPMSGPYAAASFGDAIFYGDVNLGSTEFAPLLISSYQHAYKNVYQAVTDVIEPAYATGFDMLLPGMSFSTLVEQGKLPLTQLFSSTPPAPGFAPITPPTTTSQPGITPGQAELFALGFGTNNLITNPYRGAYLLDAIANPDGDVPTVTTGLPPVNPQFGVRIDLKTNDLRNWVPLSPVLLCGGNADPTVFYSVNTLEMQGFWTPQLAAPQLLTVLDIDSAPSGPTDPFAAAKVGFATAKASVAAAAVAAGATDGGAAAVTQAYHGTLVPPFCAVSARGFFSQF
jgi:hypothetical protein